MTNQFPNHTYLAQALEDQIQEALAQWGAYENSARRLSELWFGGHRNQTMPLSSLLAAKCAKYGWHYRYSDYSAKVEFSLA